MIKYENGGIHFLLKLVQREGSVFPMAVSVAAPRGIASVILLMLKNHGIFEAPPSLR